jgi:hypothetical protein
VWDNKGKIIINYYHYYFVSVREMLCSVKEKPEINCKLHNVHAGNRYVQGCLGDNCNNMYSYNKNTNVYGYSFEFF